MLITKNWMVEGDYCQNSGAARALLVLVLSEIPLGGLCEPRREKNRASGNKRREGGRLGGASPPERWGGRPVGHSLFRRALSKELLIKCCNFGIFILFFFNIFQLFYSSSFNYILIENVQKFSESVQFLSSTPPHPKINTIVHFRR